jgi:hypothetical protein
MLNAAEQCFYCLYTYPQKRKRHLAEHSARRTSLTRERAGAVFEFILPDSHEQPEFDGYTNDKLNSEAMFMLKRIEALLKEDACMSKGTTHNTSWLKQRCLLQTTHQKLYFVVVSTAIG